MKLTHGLLFISGAFAAALPSNTQYISSGLSKPMNGFKIPTQYESAVLGRRLLALTTLGTLATVFPDQSQDVSSSEDRPNGLGGMPTGLMEYVADCEASGSPTMLAIKIGTSFKNARDGSNISLAMQWSPPYPPDKRIKSSFLDFWTSSDDKKVAVPYSAANLPRFSLLGYFEKIDTTSSSAIAQCFVDAHPDAKYWLPGNRIHESEFVRLVVQQIYWIGGFGDRAYIGWLSPDDWRNVTREEWQAVRLPGEKKGWKEWSVWNWQEL